ncbi:MAG: hypothetical protein CL907_02945 [Dehalococcoidia bacterium]|nr:hypothetical protein [Dehalococcoidia bacterium]|tara:strand:- start:37 stop:384 length:348 start_codon:yes stop_codon:yes gene_type:complete
MKKLLLIMPLIILIVACGVDESEYIKYEDDLFKYNQEYNESLGRYQSEVNRELGDKCDGVTEKWANERGFGSCPEWFKADREDGGYGGAKGWKAQWIAPNKPEKPEGYDKWKLEQ